MPDSFQMFARCSYFQWRGLPLVYRDVATKQWARGAVPVIDFGVQELYPIWSVELHGLRVPRPVHLMSVKVDMTC